MRMQFRSGQKLATILLTAMLGLTGCGGEDEQMPGSTAASGGQSAATTSAGVQTGSTAGNTQATEPPAATENESSATVVGVPTAGNSAPELSATPVSAIKVGASYSLQPKASDPDGDTLAFSIANKPSWMSFNTLTGKLSGTPQASHVGTYSNIRITVSDGEMSTSLPAFSIAVTQISTGTATLSWMPPAANTDGSALTDLAGYRIHFGTSAGALTQTIDIDNPSVSRYVVENLSPSTWYFAVKSVNTKGVESSLSGVASKTIG